MVNAIVGVLFFHLSATSGVPDSPSVIRCHPNFRMIVLANRPGFPFLGNDFFGAMGKSCLYYARNVAT